MSPSLPEAGPGDADRQVGIGVGVDDVPVTVAVLLAVLGSGLLAPDGGRVGEGAPLPRLAGREDHEGEGVGAARGDVGRCGLG